jgi:uncharacterized protein (UPF0332 family)
MLTSEQLELSRVRAINAKDCLLSAENSIETGYYKTANNRAYYAAYHAIRSLLALDDRDFSSHGQTLGYFNKTYAKTRLIDPVLCKEIAVIVHARQGSDYDDNYVATMEQAEQNVANAKRLLAAIEQLIEVRLEAELVQESIAGHGYTHCNEENEDGMEP